MTPLSRVIKYSIRGLITPLITTHEPPRMSKASGFALSASAWGLTRFWAHAFGDVGYRAARFRLLD